MLSEEYRAHTWSDVVGQDKAIARIAALWQRGLAGRAFWITGQSGTGKTTIARLICGEIADPTCIIEIDAGDCLATVERWEKSGVSLHVADLGGNAIDTTSAAGRFMLVVLAGAAEMERNLTRERTRSARAVKRANGQRIGAIPYGFDVAQDRITLVPNEAEQAVIADIGAPAVTGDEARQDRIPINRTEDTDEDWQIESLDASGGGEDTTADQGGSGRS